MQTTFPNRMTGVPRTGRHHGAPTAWVAGVDNRGIAGEKVRQAWLPLTVLRPARRTISYVWKDVRWRLAG
jgi:hypothetical protein